MCRIPAFLKAMRKLLLNLQSWVSQFYANRPAPLRIGRLIIESVSGTKLGENFWSLLFDVVLHPVILKMQELLSPEEGEHGDLASLLVQQLCHDDEYITGRFDQLVKAIEILRSVDSEIRRLYLSLPKCTACGVQRLQGQCRVSTDT